MPCEPQHHGADRLSATLSRPKQKMRQNQKKCYYFSCFLRRPCQLMYSKCSHEPAMKLRYATRRRDTASSFLSSRMRTARESYLSPAAALPSCAPSPSLANLKPINDDEKTGIDNVRRALVTPAKQIIDAGGDAAVVIGKLLEAKDYAYGFDAQIGEYADLVKKGIVDPTKVVRTALQDAASVVGLLITTEAMIAELPKRDAPAMPPGGGMDYRSR